MRAVLAKQLTEKLRDWYSTKHVLRVQCDCGSLRSTAMFHEHELQLQCLNEFVLKNGKWPPKLAEASTSN